MSNRARVTIAIVGLVVAGWWVYNFSSFLPLQNGYYQCYANTPLNDGTTRITGVVVKDDAIYTFTGEADAVGTPDWNPKALPLAKEGNRKFSAGLDASGDGAYHRYSCQYAGELRDSEDGSVIGG